MLMLLLILELRLYAITSLSLSQIRLNAIKPFNFRINRKLKRTPFDIPPVDLVWYKKHITIIREKHITRANIIQFSKVLQAHAEAA